MQVEKDVRYTVLNRQLVKKSSLMRSGLGDNYPAARATSFKSIRLFHLMRSIGSNEINVLCDIRPAVNTGLPRKTVFGSSDSSDLRTDKVQGVVTPRCSYPARRRIRK
jgi:hypothetical protein